MKDNLLILDLDETLVHSIAPQVETPSYYHVMNSFPVMGGHLLTIKRPHLDTFLEYVFDNFDVAIWTAAKKDYAEQIVENIGIDSNLLKFFYTEKECNHRYHYSDFGRSADIIQVKELSILEKEGYNLEKVLIVDDKELNVRNDFKNLIEIKPYFGQSDDMLLRLIDFLDLIKYKRNVRDINKHGWYVQ